MSAEYSLADVLAVVQASIDRCDCRPGVDSCTRCDRSRKARAFILERIKADESAVPVAEVYERPVHHDLHNSPMVKDIRFTGMPLPIGAKLYANPHSPDAADSGRVVDVSDEKIIEVCRAAGIYWIEPDADDCGFPGGFDITYMTEMRNLFAALAAQPQSAASPAGVPDGLIRQLERWCDEIEAGDAESLAEDGAGFFPIMPKGNVASRIRAMLAAAPSAPEGGEVDRG